MSESTTSGEIRLQFLSIDHQNRMLGTNKQLSVTSGISLGTVRPRLAFLPSNEQLFVTLHTLLGLVHTHVIWHFFSRFKIYCRSFIDKIIS